MVEQGAASPAPERGAHDRAEPLHDLQSHRHLPTRGRRTSNHAKPEAAFFIPPLAALVASVLLAAFLACAPKATDVQEVLLMELSAAAGSAQRITASLEDSPGGVEVAIEGSGFRPGTYRARLIVGDCSGTEEVRFQLAPLFAGEAGAVKGQALVPGVHLRDLVDSHAIVISDGASAGRLSCAPITMGN